MDDVDFKSEKERRPCNGKPGDLDPLPFDDSSSETLHQRLFIIDPESASRIHPKDHRKVIRLVILDVFVGFLRRCSRNVARYLLRGTPIPALLIGNIHTLHA